MIYADIIVNISHENLDKTYQYAVPTEFEEKAVIGALVMIPFGKGNRMIKGYIVSLSNTPQWDIKLIKNIDHIVEEGLVIESHLISLAYWMKENYGATINDALKTVIPIKKVVKKKEKRYIKLSIGRAEAIELLNEFKRKHNQARVRLLEELVKEEVIDYELAIHKLNITRPVIMKLKEMDILSLESKTIYRNPIKAGNKVRDNFLLNEEQAKIVEAISTEYRQGVRKTYLIHGVTGSGKTQVYMEIISDVIDQGKQVIMLIPEIALTYQTVMRFYKRFGDRISIMNSRLSGGERYDQYLRAKNGEIDIMIGPRSALFTPFHNLGLIIIDEEHEGSYKSESPPKYHAREVAIERGRLLSASVILGSATPSLEAYKKALAGEYKLFVLNSRAGAGTMPRIWVVDLREELKKKNKSIFSYKLKELMEDRLNKKQQIMLFINRRGYAGFVSCRSCGHVLKCSHCDISLTSHNNGKLMCHYCGYNQSMPSVCPKCGSKYIAAFGTGTQKVEELVKKEFANASVLRMDSDTTGGKDGHEKILASFSNGEADILVGTQMIVKGHDFTNVTLVGIIAADLSLFASDYRAAERTYQLLTQASGRAGRGEKKGEVVIQTYNPEHYSITTAADNDYNGFYQQELAYRSMLQYPPVANILAILISSGTEDKAASAGELLGSAIKEKIIDEHEISMIGPAKASLSKIKDIYRRMIYIKCVDYETLVHIKNYLEGFIQFSEYFKGCNIQFDFNPISSY
jgi:primosomal protein N' (replication factor Y) (superfamily II helicase)